MKSMPRILIVDDEKAIRSLLDRAFTKAGYEVRTAADGPEAIELCASEPFDVVLSDVRMPVMNGHELVRWIVRRSQNTRCVLMSGFDDIACQGCGVANQPCTLLPKPFAPAKAISLIGELLQDRSAGALLAPSVEQPPPTSTSWA